MSTGKDKKALSIVSENLKIKDSDIATVEALHDLLLDGEGYPINHPALKKVEN